MASRQPEREPAASALPADWVELGVVSGAYGVKGWVRVQPYSADASALRATNRWWLLGREAESVEVTAIRRHGSGLIAKWRDCETPEAAARHRAAKVGVSRAEFPPAGEGEVYWFDLIGTRVVNRHGVELGLVTDVLSNGVQDLLEVRLDDQVRLLPMVERYVDGVDLVSGEVRVDWEADW